MDRGFPLKKISQPSFPMRPQRVIFTSQTSYYNPYKRRHLNPALSLRLPPPTLFWPQDGTTPPPPPPHLHPSTPLLVCICLLPMRVGATTGLFRTSPAGVSWRSLARIRSPRHVTLTQRLCVLSPGGRGLTANIWMCVPISSVGCSKSKDWWKIPLHKNITHFSQWHDKTSI